MKITIDVDCTPEEARHFLGLPEIAPMQDELVAELGRRMKANLEAMDPEVLLKTWLPAGLKGFESMQKMFWTQLNKAAETQKAKTKPAGGSKA